MNDRKRILLVFNTKRQELYSYLGEDLSSDYYIIFTESGEASANLPSFIKEELFWNDYRTPFHLLNAVKPDGVVFQEVFDLKQIALNIAAKSKNIKTFFLDHGIWNDFESIKKNDLSLKSKNRRRKLGKLNRWHKVIPGYLFYFSAIRGIKTKNFGKFFVLPVIAFFKSLLTSLTKNKFPERKPDKFILFSRHNYNTVFHYYGCTEKEIVYTGFPFYDALANEQPILNSNDYIIFIDHPYLEHHILGWDECFHENVAKAIAEIAELSGKKVKIKLHPRSNKALWEKYEFLHDKAEIIQQPVSNNFYLNGSLIIGYASTMMIGFICAKKNVVLLGWHPKPQIFGIDFSLFGICHKSLSFSEVKSKFLYWQSHNLALQNEEAYQKFVEYFNYPFDGNASQRIIEIISG